PGRREPRAGPGHGARARAGAAHRAAPRRPAARRERRVRCARARAAPGPPRAGGRGVTTALVLVSVLAPAYTALLHGWLYLLRRREPSDAAFALSTLAMAGVAGGLVVQCFSDSPDA